MTAIDAGRRLSEEDREALLSRLSKRRRPDAPLRPTVVPAFVAPPSATDFTALPGYRDVMQQRAFADMVGLENPFFRVHDGRAGAGTAVKGREMSNFSSYDYLGLNGHPEVVGAAKNAIDRYGTSTSASRLVAGERPVHRELEASLAAIYEAEDCVAMVSGHATNVGVIGHIMGPKDLIVYDELIHNSVVVGAQLSGAHRRSFPHNDLDELDAMLAAARSQYARVLIVVEGLYSMDGDHPDLARAVAIKRRHGAWLMVDDAHGLGVLGRTGRGLAEHCDVSPRDVDIWMGTLSKTLAGAGGYIAGPAALVDYIKLTVGAFVYSVGLSPPVAAAAHAALDIMLREPERVSKLARNGAHFVETARGLGLDTGTSAGFAVVPVILGESLRAAMLSDKLGRRGYNVMPILHPAVPERLARLRFFVTSEHTFDQIDAALQATVEESAGLVGTAEMVEAVTRSLAR